MSPFAEDAVKRVGERNVPERHEARGEIHNSLREPKEAEEQSPASYHGVCDVACG